MSFKTTLFLVLAVAFVVVGCSNQDDPAQPGNTGQLTSAILRGEISEDQLAFEFIAKVGDGVDPDQGALLVRGRNLSYDGELGVLSVDLSVYNDSEMGYDEPVGLTFMQFMPEGVTVLNSDNDQNGAGALVLFEFENDDLTWSPGEESLAREVQFEIASGTSFGFVARIDVGMAPEGGTIGGMVWHDANGDGIMDADERGVGGVAIALHAGDDASVDPLTRVITAEDGTYRFAGQDAGYYTVVRLPLEGAVGTTPPEMAVILVEVDGVVSDFLLANFGIQRAGGPGDDFVQVGDYVNAKGRYEADPSRLVADIFNVCHCDDVAKHDGDDDDDGDGDGDDGDNDDCGECDGKMTELTLRYHGADAANIKVYKKDRPEPEKMLFEGMVDPGEDFDFVGDDNHGTMGSKITVWIDDVLNTEIHTSCSQPISVGMVSGGFEIVAGVSRQGGPLCPPPCDDCDDCEDGCRDNECWGRLAGPITGINFEDRYLEIMGTPVYFHQKTDWDPDEYHPGLRFRVDATRDLEARDADVMACRHPRWWNGNRDRVKGFVQEVVRGDDDRITGVVILNTLVVIDRD